MARPVTNGENSKIHGFPVEPHFAQVVSGKKKQTLAHSAGPTCRLSLAEEASDRLPSWDSMDQDLLSLYGQYRSTKVDHMNVEKASSFDELETSLFHFYLPSSYLSFVCSGESFDLFNLGIPPKELRPESQIGREERVPRV